MRVLPGSSPKGDNCSGIHLFVLDRFVGWLYDMYVDTFYSQLICP